MVISSDFRMGKHRDDDHEEDALHFTLLSVYIPINALFKKNTKIQILVEDRCLFLEILCFQTKQRRWLVAEVLLERTKISSSN